MSGEGFAYFHWYRGHRMVWEHPITHAMLGRQLLCPLCHHRWRVCQGD